MIQPATPQSVEGDFTRPSIVLRGATYILKHTGTQYRIGEHRVDYTLGTRRVQQYLTRLADGRIVVLPAAWDNVRKQWVHDLDLQNTEENPNVEVQVWNKSCYSCHVSGGRKNFDAGQVRYRTTWRDLGVNCERCHGPGDAHAARGTVAGIVNPARLDATRSTMVCGQCHSLRDVYVDGFQAGANYYDYFLPVLQYRLPPSDDSAFWPDGRTRWFSNDAVAFWQSECFLKGAATCVTCHSQLHSNAGIRVNENAACTKCHAGIAAKPAAHTHHAANSRGSSCVECHMPPTVIGMGSRMRDHSISVPVPENTLHHGIPNACNACHSDKDAEWALRQMNAWYGGHRRQKPAQRADAFAAAQKGDGSAIPLLLAILADRSGGPLVRANAAGFLGNFPNDPAAYEAVLQALGDPEPLVRATAVLALRPRAAQREAVAPRFAELLKDDVATVRVNAVIALIAMGVRQLPAEDRASFERAKELYRARAALDSDDAAQQFATGRFCLLAGDMDAAASAFRAALKLDPSIPAQYYLGAALVEKGDLTAAREILKSIPRSDARYDAAQRLLGKIDEQSKNGSGEAGALFLSGQTQYQNGNFGSALAEMEQALKAAPQAEWATKAQILRAICLEKLSRIPEAEAAMQALSADPAARNDVDLQLAYAELLYESGRLPEALKRTDDLIAAAPHTPAAHLWRARILLRLNRTGEAAQSAEECVRLQPELSPAHNLLMRIYQMQGRSKEAAEQAQWLRDYQRRIESR